MNERKVVDLRVRDNGEPLVDASAAVKVRDPRGGADNRYNRVRQGVAERLRQADGLLPAGLHLLLLEGHRGEGSLQDAGSGSAASGLPACTSTSAVAGHAAGAAVDVRLTDGDGHVLDRNPAVDSSLAAPEELLASVMLEAGFVPGSKERWHFSYGDRAWAALTDTSMAIYGPATAAFDHAADAAAFAVAARCDNTGRWGADDRLGTLNYISSQVRVAAASEVRLGQTVSLARPVDTTASAVNPRPAWHVMLLETERRYASADSLHLQVHGLANTHLDALGHMFLDGVGYNGVRQDDAVDMGGLQQLSIADMAGGIFTRGVLLDVAGALNKPWLEPGAVVTANLLVEAEQHSDVEVRHGDAVFVHVGLEAREHAQGPENPAVRAGLDVSAVEWLHYRQVSVYSGDCIERFPETGRALPMPLHQIGIARMGLVLLDCPQMTGLVEKCRAIGRSTFLLTAAPLVVPGGTGSPVNPVAVF